MIQVETKIHRKKILLSKLLIMDFLLQKAVIHFQPFKMVILSLQKQKLDLLLIQVGMVAQGLPNAIQELLPKMKKFYQKDLFL